MKTAVVFIHGFTGGSGTWQNDAGISFKEMLKADPLLDEEFDFFEYEYFTKITALQHSATVQKLLALVSSIPGLPKMGGKIKKNQTIANLSQGFSTHLRYALGDYLNVVVIAHSMGGLITKDLILNYEAGNGPKVLGYVSMAVPHKGSLSALLLAPIATFICRLQYLLVTPSNLPSFLMIDTPGQNIGRFRSNDDDSELSDPKLYENIFKQIVEVTEHAKETGRKCQVIIVDNDMPESLIDGENFHLVKRFSKQGGAFEKGLISDA